MVSPTEVLWQTLSSTLKQFVEREEYLDEVADLLASILPTYLKEENAGKYFRFWETHGFHLTPVHFYQPIPDTRSLTDRLWSTPNRLLGVDFNDEVQLDLLRNVFPVYREECARISTEPTGRAYEFYLNNGMFDRTDALAYYCLIRHFRPKLIIEVGAGFSSRLSAQAALQNGGSRLICIEPYPDHALTHGTPGVTTLIERRVQDVELELFQELTAGDMLFIDSSHVVSLGGDVIHLFREIVPHLKPGVLIHLHDVFLPDEYPRDWVLGRRQFWTEQHLLQAFLAFNSEFEVLFANAYLGQKYLSELQAAFPTLLDWSGGSFWMRRKSKT